MNGIQEQGKFLEGRASEHDYRNSGRSKHEFVATTNRDEPRVESTRTSERLKEKSGARSGSRSSYTKDHVTRRGEKYSSFDAPNARKTRPKDGERGSNDITRRRRVGNAKPRGGRASEGERESECVKRERLPMGGSEADESPVPYGTHSPVDWPI